MNLDFKSIDQPFSNEISMAGETYLYFGGTAYLGIPQNQDFVDLYIDGIKRFGLNNGTSRSNNIQLGIYNEAEKVAAKRFQSEDALITSSGYLAAQLTVKALAENGNLVYAPNTHPSLWVAQNPATPNSFTEWTKQIVEIINISKERNWVLVSNALNNLAPEIYNFSFLEEIERNKNITLIIDDSHGIGVNNNGLSALSNLPKRSNIERIVVASMAKALGVDAGLVLGAHHIISRLKHSNVFNGASPAAAAGLFAFIKAEEIYKTAGIKLQNNVGAFLKQISPAVKFEPGFPAFLLDNPTIGEQLLQDKILISSFPYPTENSSPINRIVLSSWHTKENIDQLVAALSKKAFSQ